MDDKFWEYASAFQKWGFIDWRQGNRKYSIGDIIYIYCTKPTKKVMYKTIVELVGLDIGDIVDDKEFWYNLDEYYNALDGKFCRIKLLEQVDRNELTLDNLMKNGLIAAPQGSRTIPDELVAYIDQYMSDSFFEGVFPDSDGTVSCVEGAKTTIAVNKYERSSVARGKCIEINGCYCHICGLDFEKIYGEIGKGFIHVHHIIPLHEIDEKYIVNPEKDLMPVCPN